MHFGSWFPPGRLFALALMIAGPLAADTFAADPRWAPVFQPTAAEPTAAEAARRAALRAEAAESRIAAISALTELIRDTDCADGDPRCAEMRLRLATLLVESAQDEHLAAIEELDAQIVRCETTKSCDPASIQLDDRRAFASWETAARLYRSVLDGWPDYPRADDASYGLAEVLFELGRPEEAATALNRMLRARPDSPDRKSVV